MILLQPAVSLKWRLAGLDLLRKSGTDAARTSSPVNFSAICADEQKHASKAAAFLQTATQETYGAGGEAASLADRVGRRKYYSERGGAH